jgi:hypothetical protein
MNLPERGRDPEEKWKWNMSKEIGCAAQKNGWKVVFLLT